MEFVVFGTLPVSYKAKTNKSKKNTLEKYIILGAITDPCSSSSDGFRSLAQVLHQLHHRVFHNPRLDYKFILLTVYVTT
jgi:hypothetical protein